MRVKITGSAIGVATAIALGAAMLPLRSHLSIATAALVLVVPVVAGVIVGRLRGRGGQRRRRILVYDVALHPAPTTASRSARARTGSPSASTWW